jgi:hypothetical protein
VFPPCIGTDCALYEDGSATFTYYQQPTITSITPNGGPLLDEAFIHVHGFGP